MLMGNKKKQRTNQYLNSFYAAKIAEDIRVNLEAKNFSDLVRSGAIKIVKEGQFGGVV